MLTSEKYFRELNKLAIYLEKSLQKKEISLKEYSKIRKGIKKLVDRVNKNFIVSKKISVARESVEFYAKQKYSEIDVDHYKPSIMNLTGKKLSKKMLKNKDYNIVLFQQHFIRSYRQRFELLNYQDSKWKDVEEKFFKSLNFRKMYNDYRKGLLDFHETIGSPPYSFNSAGINTKDVRVLKYLDKNEENKKRFGIMLETSEMSVREMQDVGEQIFKTKNKDLESNEVLQKILKSL